jgi:hypothetical protein
VALPEVHEQHVLRVWLLSHGLQAPLGLFLSFVQTARTLFKSWKASLPTLRALI